MKKRAMLFFCLSHLTKTTALLRRLNFNIENDGAFISFLYS